MERLRGFEDDALGRDVLVGITENFEIDADDFAAAVVVAAEGALAEFGETQMRKLAEF